MSIADVKETRCDIVHNIVPDGPPYFAGVAYRSIVQCNTHQMIDFAPAVGAGDLCPIGKIEQATDEALQKIAIARAEAR